MSQSALSDTHSTLQYTSLVNSILKKTFFFVRLSMSSKKARRNMHSGALANGREKEKPEHPFLSGALTWSPGWEQEQEREPQGLAAVAAAGS